MLSNRDAERARQRSLARFLEHLADRQMSVEMMRRAVKGARLAIARNRSEGLLTTLEGAFGLLPLEACLIVWPLLNGLERFALRPALFAKIVSMSTAVRRGRIPQDEIENTQRLIEAARKAVEGAP